MFLNINSLVTKSFGTLSDKTLKKRGLKNLNQRIKAQKYFNPQLSKTENSLEFIRQAYEKVFTVRVVSYI